MGRSAQLAAMSGAPTFSAYQSSPQTLPTAVWTKVSMQSEEWDVTNAFDSASTYRFTPQVAGYYQVNGSLFLTSMATGILLAIYKNGVALKVGLNMTGSQNSSNVSALVYLNGSTDYIELWGYLGLGQSLSAVASSTFFQAAMVRAA